jgi:hypothetical protein
MRLECPTHGIVPREETVKGYEINKNEYVRFELDELKALEHASSSALVIDSFVPEGAIDPVYFEDTYYLGARLSRARSGVTEDPPGRRRHVHLRGKTNPIAIRVARTGSFSSGSTSPTRSTTRPRSTGAPNRRSATRSERLLSGGRPG